MHLIEIIFLQVSLDPNTFIISEEIVNLLVHKDHSNILYARLLNNMFSKYNGCIPILVIQSLKFSNLTIKYMCSKLHKI